MIKKYIGLIFVILVILILWYHIPLNVNKTINAYDLNGKHITVKFNVSWHKYLFKPTELQGKFCIDDGRVYQIVKSHDNTSLFNKIEFKISDIRKVPAFIRVENSKYVASDIVFLYISDDSLDKICLNIKEKDNNYYNYYGPAKTVHEATFISKNIFDKSNTRYY